MEKELFNDLKRMTEVPGIPGHEYAVRELFNEMTQEYVNEYVTDGLGSHFAVLNKQPSLPKVLMGAHFDEVGFIVSNITEKGFIQFVPAGGWWSQVLLAQQLTIITNEGKRIHGVVGSKPPHALSLEARKQPYPLEDMFIDIGASSEEEVREWGVQVGDMITPYIETRRMNGSKFLLGKAWDNRIGVMIIVEAIRRLKGKSLPNTAYLGANVQEEVGLRGAKTATHMIQPDIAFAIDTGLSGDTPGMTPKESNCKLGAGPELFVMDHSMIAHVGLRNFVIKVAEELNIPYQLTTTPGGGTDAGSQHLSLNGIPSFAIAVPVRYLHSHTSMIHEDDFLKTVDLVVALLERLDEVTINEIKNA
ncbi:M42 family metallopeptidase [Atopobacter phocae]|uniref:M42 family metallopeptidase n=1 Tax=Atopobacter phocae TaxID=136492 RepID=UPI000471C4AA|nr:M42 family metallopeptidase [Atopobacter phocae]